MVNVQIPFAVLPPVQGACARCVCVPSSRQAEVIAGATAAHRWLRRSNGYSLHEALISGRSALAREGDVSLALAFEAGFLGRLQQRLERRRVRHDADRKKQSP